MPTSFKLLDAKHKSFRFEKDGYTATLSRREILQLLSKHLQTEKGQLPKLKKYQSLKNEYKLQTYPLTITLRNKAGITQETCFEVGFTQAFIDSKETYYSSNKILGKGVEGTVKTTTATPKTSLSRPHLKNKKIIKIATKKYTSDADLNIPKEIENTKLFDSECEYLGYRIIQTKDKEKYIKHYYTQTHADGIPLEKLLPTISKNSSLTETLQIFKSIADKVQNVHKHLVHSDLHEGNILIDYVQNDFTATIIDFGLAVKNGEAQSSGITLRSEEENYFKETISPTVKQKRTQAGEISPLGVLFLQCILPADALFPIYVQPTKNYNIESIYIVAPDKLSETFTIASFPNVNQTQFQETWNKIYALFEGMLNNDIEKRWKIDKVIEQINSIQKSYQNYLKEGNPAPHKNSIANLYQTFIDEIENLLDKQIAYPTTNSFVNIYIDNLKKNIANLKKPKQQTLKKVGKLCHSLYGLHSLLENYLPSDANLTSSLLDKHKEIIETVGSSYLPKLYNDQEAELKIKTCPDEKQLVAIYNHYIVAFAAKEKKNCKGSGLLLGVLANDIKKRQKDFFEFSKKNTQHLLKKHLLQNSLTEITSALKIYESTSRENTAEENLKPLVDVPFNQLKKVKKHIEDKLCQPFIRDKDISEVLNDVEKYTRQLYDAKSFLEVWHPKTTWYHVIAQLFRATLKFFNVYLDKNAAATSSVEKSSNIINAAITQLSTFKKIGTTPAPATLIHRLFFSGKPNKMRTLLSRLEANISVNITPIELQALFPANKSVHLYSSFADNLQKISETTLTPPQKALKNKLLAAITIGLDKLKTAPSSVVDSNLINEKLSPELEEHFTSLKKNVDKLSSDLKEKLQSILNKIDQLLATSEEGAAVYLEMTNSLNKLKAELNQARQPLANIFNFFNSNERVNSNNIQNCLKSVEDIESYINQDDSHALRFSNGL